MLDTDGVAIRENRSRRRGWTAGSAVVLADGIAWRLPVIDLALMISTAGLQRDLIRVFGLARETQSDPVGTSAHSIKLTLYHSHMAHLAIRLLQVNYELPDDDWKLLLSFDSLLEMLTFTQATSSVFGDSLDVWLPFLTTAGVQGRELLSQN